jgi:molybdate transport system regulatory protein
MGTSAKLSLRVDLSPPDAGRVGPGKIALLEAIRDQRSISAAARELDMSYRRAWLLLDAMNRSFKTAVVTTATGGKRGGGAELSPAGEHIIKHYRDLEKAVQTAASPHLRALQQLVGR